MEQETKISLLTVLGAVLSCLALGWIIRDNIDNIAPLIIFIVGILGVFGAIYWVVDGKRWENVISIVREEFAKRK